MIHPDTLTIRCRHCGPVLVSDPAIVRAMLDIVEALARGFAPLGAITCPLCRDEVRARDVSPVPVCEVCGETGCTKAECADAAVRR